MSRHRRSRSSREDRYEQESPQASNNQQGGFNLASLAGLINSIDINQLAQSINQAGALIERQEEKGIRTAPNADIIIALRTLINADKAMLLQTFIQLLAASWNQKK